jgi:hypothetical protein
MSSHEIEAQGDHPSLSIGVADFGGPSLSS